MLTNVTGMSQHADGGLMTTKPYAAGGAYIDRMSDYCGPCAYDPKVRVGERACPFTAGYWAFLDRNAERLRDNRRMRQRCSGCSGWPTGRRWSRKSGSGGTPRPDGGAPRGSALRSGSPAQERPPLTRPR